MREAVSFPLLGLENAAHEKRAALCTPGRGAAPNLARFAFGDVVHRMETQTQTNTWKLCDPNGRLGCALEVPDEVIFALGE